MSQPLTAREAILQRIRTALPGAPANLAGSYAAIARPYRQRGALSPSQFIELFLDRLHDYDTEVLQPQNESGIADAIAQALRHAGEDRVLLAPEFPAALRPAGVDLVEDRDLSIAEIEQMPAVLTTSEAAVAETGTIFLVHTGAQGRRILTLLPDHHICIVRHSRLFATLPEALAAIDGSMARPITSISGPSATSDIEMIRVRGVHGPRRLTVILCP